MKRLLYVVIAAATLWSGYWFVGSRAATAGFEAWFAQRQAEGWVADVSDITTRGFPSRFDTTLSDVSLADPDTGLAYAAPFLQIFALSYKPQHLIAVWPNSQTMATPYGSADITSTDMRASLVVAGGDSLALERSHFAAQELQLSLPDNQAVRAQAWNMAVEKVAASQSAYQFGLDIKDLSLPRPAQVYLETGDLLPETFETARGNITVTFDAPWDLNAIQVARPQPRKIDLTLIEARWGHLELKLAGALDVDADGIPSGKITVKAQNWRDILTLAVASGILPAQLERPVEQALSLLSGLSGNPRSLDLPLDFTKGRVLFGPIPLGPAPRIVLR